MVNFRKIKFIHRPIFCKRKIIECGAFSAEYKNYSSLRNNIRPSLLSKKIYCLPSKVNFLFSSQLENHVAMPKQANLPTTKGHWSISWKLLDACNIVAKKKIEKLRGAINSSLASYMEILFIWEFFFSLAYNSLARIFLCHCFFPLNSYFSVAPQSRETLLSISILWYLIADFNAATWKCLAQNNLLFAL